MMVFQDFRHSLQLEIMSNLDLDKIMSDLGRAKGEFLASHKMPTPSGCPEGEIVVHEKPPKSSTWGDSLLSSAEIPYDLGETVIRKRETRTLAGECVISELNYMEMLRSKGSAEAVKEFALRQALRKLVETADITGLTDWHESISLTGSHTFIIKLDILT